MNKLALSVPDTCIFIPCPGPAFWFWLFQSFSSHFQSHQCFARRGLEESPDRGARGVLTKSQGMFKSGRQKVNHNKTTQPPVFISDYGWRAEEASPRLLEEEALRLLGQHPLLELLHGGPGPLASHPEPLGAPVHLPQCACAEWRGGASGRGSPSHQPLLRPDPCGRARGLLGARRAQIGRGLPQGGAH